MLQMTGIELEINTDIDMQLFIEKGMKGGISCITKRHSEANNKHLKCMTIVKKIKLLCAWIKAIYMVGP